MELKLLHVATNDSHDFLVLRLGPGNESKNRQIENESCLIFQRPTVNILSVKRCCLDQKSGFGGRSLIIVYVKWHK